MSHLKIMTVGTLAIIGLLTNTLQANAWDTSSHHHLHRKDTQKPITAEQKMELRNYMKYELREPCQNYRELPDGFYRDGCRIIHEEPQVRETKRYMQKEVLIAYKVNFAFDSASIDGSAVSMLDRVANEINKYNPSEVIVSGYTDRAGSSDYNDKLSKSRALSVSEALTRRGVANRVIEQESYGERNSAVETNDGVALLENRRVIIEFLK